MRHDGDRGAGPRSATWSSEPTDPRSFTARFDRFYTRSARWYAAAVRRGPVWRRWLGHALPHIRGDRVLEVSVGTGWLVSQYAGRFDTIGVDLNAAMLRETAASTAEAGVRVPLVRADVGALPFREHAFDAIVDTMAFSGYPDGAAAMTELRRVLAPDGRIVMVDVSFPTDGNRIGTLLARAWQLGGDILRDLPALLRAQGFSVATREIGGWGSVHLFVAEPDRDGGTVPELLPETGEARPRPEPGTALSRERAQRFYDRIGRLQDTQAFYEDPAIDDLVAHADFEHAHDVVELGPGTGRLAHRLLTDHLPDDGRYRGVELSPRMADIAADRLRPFGAQASVERGDAADWPPPNERADRVVATYVFDLLDDDVTDALLDRIARVLSHDGALCVVSLAEGPGGAARAVSNVWTALWRRRPGLVGGCRPIRLRDRLEAAGWTIDHHGTVTAWLLTSEVLVARPPATG